MDKTHYPKILISLCLCIIWTIPYKVNAQKHALSIEDADSVAQKADEVYNEGNYERAWQLYKKAIDTYESHQDTLRWLKHAFPYAEVQVDLGRYSEALKLLKKIKRIDHPHITTSYKARLYNDFGWANSKMGNDEIAIKRYLQALEYAKQARDSTEMAILYSNLGSVQTDQSNFDKAINYLERALEMNKGMNRKFGIAINYNNLGYAYAHLNLYKKAIEYHRMSIELRKELDRPDMLAVAYNNLALALKNKGNFSQAVITYQKSLELMLEYSSPDEIGKALNNIGSLYDKLDDMDNAASYYHKSLRIKKEHNSERSIAITLNHLGNLYLQKAEYDSARYFYNRALEINKNQKNRKYLARSYLNLSRLKAQKSNYQTAITHARRALEYIDPHEWPDLLSSIHLQLGDIYYSINEFDKSLIHNQKGYNLVNKLTPKNQIGALKNLARSYNKIDRDSAYYYGEMAVSYIEEARTQVGASSVLRARSFSRHTEFYKVLAIWYLKEGTDLERAYNLIELSKARSLNEQLAQKKSINKLDSAQRQKFIRKQQVAQDIASISRLIENTDSIEKREQLKQKLNNKELQYYSLLNQLDMNESNVTYQNQPNPISLSKIQEYCSIDDALLQFAITDEHTVLIVITKEEVETYIHKHSINRNKIAESVDNYRNDIIEHEPMEKLAQLSEDLLENELNPLLISKAMDKDHWIISADGPFAYLPFEALVKDGKYLVENYTISYLPSLTSLKYLPDNSTTTYNKDILAVGSADFSQNKAASAVTRQDYYTLPSTLVEVDSITAKFDKTTKLKRAEVTEEHIKSLPLKEYRYIHFATHGVYDEQNPMLSRLLLTTNQPLNALSNEDGFLHVSEIYDMDINADMVVLSACNTGVGSLISGEGIMGMQRAFFTAGASTVVVSLWNVFDRSTTTLMNYFYNSLENYNSKEGNGIGLDWFSSNKSSDESTGLASGEKAEALRDAKEKMLNHPMYNHPVYWAPFITVGN